MLEKNTSLTELYLSGNEIGDEGLVQFINVIEKYNGTISYLNLENKLLTESSLVNNLRELLKNNKLICSPKKHQKLIFFFFFFFSFFFFYIFFFLNFFFQIKKQFPESFRKAVYFFFLYLKRKQKIGNFKVPRFVIYE